MTIVRIVRRAHRVIGVAHPVMGSGIPQSMRPKSETHLSSLNF